MMLNNIYFKNDHLTALAFFMLESGELSDSEKQLLLFHLSSCDECMNRYVESLTEDTLIEPPADLEQKIISKISYQKITKKQSKTVFIQFAKLAVAVSITMVLFISGVFELIGSMPNEMIQNTREKKPEQNHIANIADDFTNSFNDFALKINNKYKGEKDNERK